jgi:CDP-glycerol glycerophosphotransferase (TagB/SpsB family)
MNSKRIFISADHGLAVVYFLQSDVVPTLLDAGVEVVILTDDGLKEQIIEKFGQPGLSVEGLRWNQAREYGRTTSRSAQYWIHFLRRVGCSNRINTEAVDTHVNEVAAEAEPRRKALMPFMRMIVGLLRRSKIARRTLVNMQQRYIPYLYTDLFDKYKPDMVLSSSPGWRLDRYLLREAAVRKIPTTAVVMGWDNSSSYSLPGAPVQKITCWSEIQKEELVLGSDWDPAQVNIGGIPSYDGYFRKKWLIPRDEYFRLHNLEPNRKLLSYASSFVPFSPNIQNVEALARLVNSDKLPYPSQVLIRLHPNHFISNPLYRREKDQMFELAKKYPHVHVVEPVPLGGEYGYYSGEDMFEKASMMAYSDVFSTVYSTMVVEASIHNVPIIALCIDAPGGWNTRNKFSLPLSKVGDWPTHSRFRNSGAGRVALSEEQLGEIVKMYLNQPDLDREKQKKFLKDEVTFTDGSAGRRTGECILSWLGK